jgi:hypothetical protein
MYPWTAAIATVAKWVKLHLAPIFSTYLSNNGSTVELILKTSGIQKIIVKFHLLTE